VYFNTERLEGNPIKIFNDLVAGFFHKENLLVNGFILSNLNKLHKTFNKLLTFPNQLARLITGYKKELTTNV
jgi:hypothetical protein